jgi:hypothetical protein
MKPKQIILLKFFKILLSQCRKFKITNHKFTHNSFYANMMLKYIDTYERLSNDSKYFTFGR